MRTQTRTFITGIILILACFTFFNSYSQKSVRDSLLLEYNKINSDSIKVEILYQLTREFYRINLDSSKIFLQKGIELSKNMDYLYGVAVGKYFEGKTFFVEGNLEESLLKFQEALELFEELNNDEGIARTNLALGEILFQQAWDESPVYFEKSINIFKKINDKGGLVDGLSAMALVSCYSGDYEQSINLIQQSLELRKTISKEQLSKIYSYSYPTYEMENNLGYNYLLQGKYEKALPKFYACLDAMVENEITFQRAYVLINIADSYSRSGKVNEAKRYGQEAYKVATEGNYLDDIRYVTNFLKGFYRDIGEYKRGFEMQEKYIAVNDSLNIQLVGKNALKYEHEKDLFQIEEEQKRKDLITEKEKQRQLLLMIWIVSGLAATLVFVLIIYNKLRQIKRQNKIIDNHRARMEKELVVAHDIQMSMIPRKFPVYVDKPEFDLYGIILPAREVGGDFYDFYMLDDTNLFLCVGDVSGKGAGAALFMALAKSVTKAKTAENPSPAYILTELNNELSQNNDSHMFVTMFAATLNISSGKMTYTNAGHNPTLIKKKNGTIELLNILHGPVVAAMEDITYDENEVQLKKDDLVVLYTDGVTEAMNPDNQLYSDQRFYDLVANLKNPLPKTLITSAVDDVLIHTAEAEQFDDITMLTLQYKI